MTTRFPTSLINTSGSRNNRTGSSVRNDGSSGASPASFVQSRSVQSQFAALTQARDEMRTLTDSSDRERRQHEAAIQQLRVVSSSLQHDITKAHATLGTFSKKKELLSKEVARLVAVLQQERTELEYAQTKLKVLQDKTKQGGRNFSRSMATINADLAILMQQREDLYWQELLLSTGAVETLCEYAKSKGYSVPDGVMVWNEAAQERNDATAQHSSMAAKVEAVREVAIRSNSGQVSHTRQAWKRTDKRSLFFVKCCGGSRLVGASPLRLPLSLSLSLSLCLSVCAFV